MLFAAVVLSCSSEPSSDLCMARATPLDKSFSLSCIMPTNCGMWSEKALSTDTMSSYATSVSMSAAREPLRQSETGWGKIISREERMAWSKLSSAVRLRPFSSSTKLSSTSLVKSSISCSAWVISRSKGECMPWMGSSRSLRSVACCITSLAMALPSCSHPAFRLLRTWSMSERMRWSVVSTSVSYRPRRPQSALSCSRMACRRLFLPSLAPMAMSIAVLLSSAFSSSTSFFSVFCRVPSRSFWFSRRRSISSCCDCMCLANSGMSISSSNSRSASSPPSPFSSMSTDAGGTPSFQLFSALSSVANILAMFLPRAPRPSMVLPISSTPLAFFLSICEATFLLRLRYEGSTCAWWDQERLRK
mmetsp:Transcript_24085/g.53561  ORF Transcript_24085/g.53561 Transcript_24085/m.53561 type:complete len:361 (+) Transcript_24085:6032-7114(+)